jgi:2-oxoisovalerate dehydrogenase E2 component (dihydrolipoyl transacylase)
VKPQGSIQSFDPLCEVQSDKATVEITSPFDGIVKELLVQEGEVAKVGEGLCMIEVDEEVAENNGDLAPVEHVSLPAEKSAESEMSSNSREDTFEPVDLEDESHEEPVSKRRLHPLDPNRPLDSLSASSNVLATPSVRHFSRQKGVDLGQLAPGTGKGGRIEKKDVEAYLARSTPGQARVGDTQDVVVELGRTRHGMWKAMIKVRIFVPSSEH